MDRVELQIIQIREKNRMSPSHRLLSTCLTIIQRTIAYQHFLSFDSKDGKPHGYVKHDLAVVKTTE